ncbi:hypothetical protein ACIBEJ_34910 [Nonomuraea sp. NPDC050790]|uniref:hypothetical protein n=1 Tax=Nonomuraea sp. NPDC050790 TaxID=3364371 RepID=UPI0037AEE8BF
MTVTESASSAPSPAINNTQMPSDSFNFWTDVVLGDFGGAFLGVLGAAAIAWWLARREREARLDERRRDQAERVGSALWQLHASLGGSEIRASDVHAAIHEVRLAITPLGAPHKKDAHPAFRDWFRKVTAMLPSLVINELNAIAETADDSRRGARVNQLRDHIALIIADVQRWGSSPEGWTPLTPGPTKTPSEPLP